VIETTDLPNAHIPTKRHMKHGRSKATGLLQRNTITLEQPTPKGRKSMKYLKKNSK
jgi:hypothetical protein